MKMNRELKAKKIGDILNDLYPKTPVPLNHSSAYTLLVAVMLSAQTTDKKVNEVTPGLFKKANTPEKMRKLSVKSIEQEIKQVGLAPTKAKNLKKMAQQITDAGGLKSDWDFLESLAGVGHKTASVVMSQWYGFPAFPVDTHIHRLAARWGLSKAKNVEMTERDLKKVWPESEWNRRHLQIIFFGREFCPARNHNLSDCIICGWAATKKRIMHESLSR